MKELAASVQGQAFVSGINLAPLWAAIAKLDEAATKVHQEQEQVRDLLPAHKE